MNDLISRKMAIDALLEEHEKIEAYMEECLKLDCFALRSDAKKARNRIEEDIYILENLPSAQPERNDNFEKQIHAMFDHIWDCEIDHPVFQATVGELMGAVIQRYKSLHTAQKTGTWLVAKGVCERDYMECNQCGWIFEYYGGLEEEWNYCPHCGARMEAE